MTGLDRKRPPAHRPLILPHSPKQPFLGKFQLVVQQQAPLARDAWQSSRRVTVEHGQSAKRGCQAAAT